MLRIIGVMGSDAGEQILKTFVRHEIPVAQRLLAKLGQLIISAAIDGDADTTLGLKDLLRIFTVDYIEHLTLPNSVLTNPRPCTRI